MNEGKGIEGDLSPDACKVLLRWRSRIEAQIGRWKSFIGPRLQFCSFSRQITEVQLGQKILNTMTALEPPVFERMA